MESIEDLKKALEAIMKIDKVQREAASGLGAIPPQYLNPGGEERMRALMDQQLESITLKNWIQDIARLKAVPLEFLKA